ncbi:myoD family inhibitor domain-containing protein-like [Kryptolebias marmoratus]|uniref:myoD family inhibitor domain-containing protein-like n=1 Tax=Kryptolebias marmoratus TaxID=37003 RepID=UPI0007F8E5D1|nr:myoD family inhibitor domain-containing protein-like [Kryptolebias marmoratus]
MAPEEHLPVKGSESLKPAEEILSEGDPARRGNATSTDLISTQPLPAADPPSDASQDAGGIKKPQRDFQKPTCSQCGLTVPDHRLQSVSWSPKQLQSSKSSMSSSQSSGRSRSRSRSVPGSHHTAAAPKGSCFPLLLACLWCQCSVLVLGLLEACSSCCCCCCCCCQACARCCSGLQDVPTEELRCHSHCHSVLFETCCEPTECLEFCLDCCEICHRS